MCFLLCFKVENVTQFKAFLDFKFATETPVQSQRKLTHDKANFKLTNYGRDVLNIFKLLSKFDTKNFVNIYTSK